MKRLYQVVPIYGCLHKDVAVPTSTPTIVCIFGHSPLGEVSYPRAMTISRIVRYIASCWPRFYSENPTESHQAYAIPSLDLTHFQYVAHHIQVLSWHSHTSDDKSFHDAYRKLQQYLATQRHFMEKPHNHYFSLQQQQKLVGVEVQKVDMISRRWLLHD